MLLHRTTEPKSDDTILDRLEVADETSQRAWRKM